MAANPVPEVVIVGGGFGGLYAAQALRNTKVNVTLLDRRNFHLFQPLLYQVATGGLSPANIAAPLRAVLKYQKNTRVLLAEVTGFDLAQRRVLVNTGDPVPFDYLIVAAGSRHHYFGNDTWEALAPGLKTVEDATDLRRRILMAFEIAERATDEATRSAQLTFAIVGGGPTGVEMAGSISELARQTLRRNFRSINPASARIVLIEFADRVLPPFAPKLSTKAGQALTRMGVELWTQTRVIDMAPGKVTVERAGKREALTCATVVWAAGVKASPLALALASACGITPDNAGRVPVTPDLSLVGHPHVFAIGDMALLKQSDGRGLPGLAPVAMQQGSYVAKLIAERLRGKSRPPFAYKDRGTMATIGRNAAVADLFGFKFSGYLAWLAWLLLHLALLVAFENRLLVLTQWWWNYLTRNRAARLITGEK
jgi:NADH dehydrogenase